MTISTFNSPHCYRARCDDTEMRILQRPDRNEGFFFVYCGVIEIDHNTAELRVYERDVWRQGNAPSLLTIDLSHPLTKIEFQLIRSGHSRYAAGRIRINCQTERGFMERITLKVTKETYQGLGRLLVEIGV